MAVSRMQKLHIKILRAIYLKHFFKNTIGKRARSLELDELQDCVEDQLSRAYFRSSRPAYLKAVKYCQDINDPETNDDF